MKKFSIYILIHLLTFFSIFSLEMPEGFSEYLLQNGMHVFILEDFSIPTVRIEYTARAGIGMQEAENAGFFPLYSRLFSNAGKYALASGHDHALQSLSSECNADSARYVITSAPAETETILQQLATAAYSPVFQDAELNHELRKMKDEIADNAFSLSGFINSSIDSRLFSESPWKHDSGIYPALFKKTTNSQCRKILSEIAYRYYSPQNSALFISGGITEKEALEKAEKTFGSHKARSVTIQPDSQYVKDNNGQKNFVLTDSQLSEEMNQIVVQFTSLNMEQCDIAAAILNSRFSKIKQELTSNQLLSIQDEEYINFDSAHKNSISRIILQAIMTRQQKISAWEQCNSFEKILSEKITDFTETEFEYAKIMQMENFRKAVKDSTSFMNMLSQFWALDGFSDERLVQTGGKGDETSLIHRFLQHDSMIMAENYEDLKIALASEKPWIFMLVHPANLKKCQKDFTKNGFPTITAKNGSWYTQELFAKIREQIENPAKKDQPSSVNTVTGSEYADFHKKNFSSGTTSNGTVYSIYHNPQSQTFSASLYIKGGEYKSTEIRKGIESVIVNAIARNIQRRFFIEMQEGKLHSIPEISSRTDTLSSIITVEGFPEDTESICRCMADAFFFDDILASDVDSLIFARKSEQIIKTGTLTYQLFAAGIKNLFPKSYYEKLFSTEHEILKNVEYAEILEYHNQILNPQKLQLIFTGKNEGKKLEDIAKEYFSTFTSSYENSIEKARVNPSAKQAVKVKLQHTFLTDISAEKAGPRPAVLIPTTDFADPVQYWIKRTSDGLTAKNCIQDAVFSMLCSIIKEKLEGKYGSDNMSIQNFRNEVLCGHNIFSIMNVKYISKADLILSESINDMMEKLTDENESQDFTSRIKNEWLKKYFDEAGTSSGMISIIKAGMDKMILESTIAEENTIPAYIMEYESVMQAGTEDFKECAMIILNKEHIMKIYSADSKK